MGVIPWLSAFRSSNPLSCISLLRSESPSLLRRVEQERNEIRVLLRSESPSLLRRVEQERNEIRVFLRSEGPRIASARGCLPQERNVYPNSNFSFTIKDK